MAKERNLPSKSTLTTSDFIRVVGSDNASYKQDMTSVKTLFGAVWHSYTQTTRESLLAQIDDDMTASGQNAYFGYMTGTQTTLLGLPNASCYLIGGANSANYRYIRFIRTDGSAEYMLTKQNGTWASNPIYLPTRAEMDSSLQNVIQSTATATITNTTNLDTLELGFYGFNFWIDGSSTTGAGHPNVKTLGLLMHIRLASNSYIQVILGQDYVATRTRSATNATWSAWKSVTMS